VKALDKFFKISERGSTVGREVRGGFVTFFAMSYIVVLNPILLDGPDANGNYLDANGTGSIAAATALIAAICSILMGLGANFPVGIAAGIGISSVLGVCISTLPGATWEDLMGLVVIEGVVILVLVLTGFRKAIFNAVPRDLRLAIGIGIGLFIAFIGFYDSGFIHQGSGTVVMLGENGSIVSLPVLVFVITLISMFVLSMKKVKGAILISIIGSTILAAILELVLNGLGRYGGYVDDNGNNMFNSGGWISNIPWPTGNFVSLPDLSTFGHFNLLGSFSHIGIATAILLAFSLILTDFFDAMGTIIGVANQGNINDESGDPIGIQRIFTFDALAAVIGGLGGSGSNTAYVESTSGVAEGARTGLAAVVTGFLFIGASFLTPLVDFVPAEAATPALVFVGFLMLTQIGDINWKDWSLAIPAFTTIIIMPFTYSITNGIGAGFIMYVIMKLASGKLKEIHPLMWGVSAAFLIYFAEGAIMNLLTWS
jgi:AGZA family xanthine/uracil permease-like MFS transporter